MSSSHCYSLFEPVNGVTEFVFKYIMDWMVIAGDSLSLPDSYNNALSGGIAPPLCDHDPSFHYAHAISISYSPVHSLVDVAAGILVGLPIFFFGGLTRSLWLLTEGLYDSLGCSEMPGSLATSN